MSLPSKPELSDSALDALIARERTRVVAPLTEWHTLAAALSAEGVIRPQASQASYGASHDTSYDTSYDARFERTNVPAAPRQPAPRGRIARWGTRIAMGATLLGAGFVVGQATSIAPTVVPIATKVLAELDSTPQTPIKSPAQAQTVLARSERQAMRAATQYQRAAAYLATTGDTTARIVGGPELYQERLAALDEMLATTRQKLESAPADPIINQYYQSQLTARERTLQQLGQTLPANVQVSHY